MGGNYPAYNGQYYQNYRADPMSYQNVYQGPQYMNPQMMPPGVMNQYAYQAYPAPNGMGNPQQKNSWQGNNFDNNKNQKQA